MLASQESLPRLPVPELQQTLTKYLKSLKALLDDNEYESNRNIVKEFGQAGGMGEKLTKMIQERAKTHDSWVLYPMLYCYCLIHFKNETGILMLMRNTT